MSGPNTNGESDAEVEGWFVDQTIHITLPSDISAAELMQSLEANRARLNRLKFQYWQLRQQCALDDPESKTFRSELSRAVNAIEAIKDKLALKATDYDILREDREHPERTRRRLERDHRTAVEQEQWEAEQRRLEAMDPISRFFHGLFN